MSSSARAAAVVVAALALAGTAAAAVALRTGGGARNASARSAAVPTGTAAVRRGTVTASDLVAGTLGYADSYRVTGQLSGLLTWLPAPGAVVARGERLYEVDGRPVCLLYGARPAWRPFAAGMADGPDVAQLEQNLVALGYHPGAVDDHFTAATAAAVTAWQRHLGLAGTGTLALGTVAFLPGAIRVTDVPGGLGQPAGGPVLTGSSTRRAVTVPLEAQRQGQVHAGDAVRVRLPDGGAAAGRVATVARVATAAPQQDGGQQNAPPTATVTVTVLLDDPNAGAGLDQAPVQVAITSDQHADVLIVPVSALLARPGGGYDVRVVAGGARRRLAVRPGLFDEDGGVVEVSGAGLRAGLRVEVPAP